MLSTWKDKKLRCKSYAFLLQNTEDMNLYLAIITPVLPCRDARYTFVINETRFQMIIIRTIK